MPKKVDADVPDYIVQGELIEKLPGALYNVKIADGTVLVCHLTRAGHHIYVKEMMPKVGDIVLVEVSPYDPTRGRMDINQFVRAYQAEKRRLKKLAKMTEAQ